jgi:hypothetical protein
MTSEQRLESARRKIDEVALLVVNNEYEQFFVSHLLPIQCEIKRQLTNIRSSAKIKE